MAEKKYPELIPRTLEQRYQFAIISELVAVNKNLEKLNRELKKSVAKLDSGTDKAVEKPKPAPKKRAPAKPKAKAEPKEVKENDV